MKYSKIAKTDRDIKEAWNLINNVQLPVVIKVAPYVKDRSSAQNRLMHMWLTDINDRAHEVTGKCYGVEAWKLFFKDLFLGYEIVEVPKFLLNGIFAKASDKKGKLKSTADLNTKEFTEFLEKIDHWAIDNLELQLPYPDDLFQEAMGRSR